MNSRATTMDYAGAFEAAARSRLAGSVVLRSDATENEKVAYVRNFTDERGHRRLVDKPLLAWMLDVPLEKLLPSPLRSHDHDVAVWTALATGQEPANLLLQSTEGSDNSPFVPLHDAATIEVATELELASLHAMFNHAHFAQHPRALRARIYARTMGAATWLLDNLQPDNATNHPWAAHVFASIAQDQAHPLRLEAALYAQALLHNSMIPQGVPDAFSALVLLDAARQLRASKHLSAEEGAER